MSNQEPFQEWVILELMGHRKLAGRLSEREIAGKGFLQLDIPGADGGFHSEIYSPDSVYCITPVEKQIAETMAMDIRRMPIHRLYAERVLKAHQLSLPVGDEDEDSEEDYEDEDP